MASQVEIIIGKTAGFCYGVERAVEETEKILKESEKNIYCLGEIVHNQQVVDKLENSGLNVIDNLEEIEDSQNKNIKVIIRAHGEPPKTYKILKEKECEVIELTCPNVLAIHKIAKEFSDKGYYIFIIGKKGHPEVIGTFGFCEYASVIEELSDIDMAISNLKQQKSDKLLIIAQTTFSLAKFNEYVRNIDERLNDDNINVETKNTICNATKLRQEETEKISKQVEYMIIVGGKNSSNTKKLYEIAKQNCKNSICIETAEEISNEKLKEIANSAKSQEKFLIGIMAGASTPKKSIQDVYDKIRLTLM